MSAARILIVEDDDDLRGLTAAVLERAGMQTLESADGTAGLRSFYADKPDLVILDLKMPGLDGWEVLRRIRELSDVPVLMLTASDAELEKVRGLREGADDYVTKPFGHQELVARVEALLRRGGREPQLAEVIADEHVEVDFGRRRVTVAGSQLELTPTEFRMLTAFVRHPDQVLSRDQLLELVWGDSLNTSADQVKLYVGYLRRKLSAVGADRLIETVRGFGYRYRRNL